MIALLSALVYAGSDGVCIDNTTYAECDCGAGGAISAGKEALMVYNKRCCRRDAAVLDDEYVVIYASSLSRGCYKIVCDEKCEIVHGAAEKCAFFGPSGKVVVRGYGGRVLLRYAGDLIWMYVLYAVVAVAVVAIVVITLICTHMRGKGRSPSSCNTSLDNTTHCDDTQNVQDAACDVADNPYTADDKSNNVVFY